MSRLSQLLLADIEEASGDEERLEVGEAVGDIDSSESWEGYRCAGRDEGAVKEKEVKRAIMRAVYSLRMEWISIQPILPATAYRFVADSNKQRKSSGHSLLLIKRNPTSQRGTEIPTAQPTAQNRPPNRGDGSADPIRAWRHNIT